MTSWFVSTTRSAPGSHYGFEWLLIPCRTEDEAKAFASRALARGLRIEAGTVPGIEPPVRIDWRAAHHSGAVVQRGLDHEPSPTPGRVCRLRDRRYKAGGRAGAARTRRRSGHGSSHRPAMGASVGGPALICLLLFVLLFALAGETVNAPFVYANPQ